MYTRLINTAVNLFLDLFHEHSYLHILKALDDQTLDRFIANQRRIRAMANYAERAREINMERNNAA